MKYAKYIIAVVGLLLGVFILVSTFGKVKIPAVDLKKSFRAIDAEAKAKKLEKELGKKMALETIEKEYATEIAALDEKEAEEHARIKDDPIKLAKLLAGKKT